MSVTHADFFDNNTDFITSAVYTSGTKKLELTFSNELNGTQAAAAVLQSICNFLISNTDSTINLAASNPTRVSSSRNGVPKDQINYSIQVYTPASSISYDPTKI
jgi:hypothetical protein